MMNRQLQMATLLATAGLAGCGDGGGVDAMTRTCLSTSNMGEAVCECVAGAARQELSERGFAFVLAGMQKNDEETARLRGEMEMSEIMAAATFMVSAPMKCAMEQDGN